jgi:tricorn protease
MCSFVSGFAGIYNPDDIRKARLLRTPAIGGGKIVFSFAGDLYSVDENGGIAVKLTSDPGYEIFPRISPDGETIAFTGQYDGNTEVYTMPLGGGQPRRITYSASLERDNMGDRMGPNNIAMTWTPDGKSILYYSRMFSFDAMRGHLMLIDQNGGVPREIPATSGGFCSFAPDGRHLAMNRMFREFRTWKHYEGGEADDIWLADLKTGKMENLTNERHQDIIPMYIGDKIYFLSDRDHTMNLFSYDLKSRKTEKLTDFDKYDIKFPSNSGKYIVFENGGYIYKYSVIDNTCKKVDIRLNDEGEFCRSRWMDAYNHITYCDLSPDAKRVVVTARGDVFSVPAKSGATYDITKTDYAHEREAQWSPDGRSIAYLSDISGEYELYTVPADMSSSPKQITSGDTTYKLIFKWAPDSKSLVYATETKKLYRVSTAGTERLVYEDRERPITDFVFSPDSRWLAFTSQAPNRIDVIKLLNMDSGKTFEATTEWYNSEDPVFSSDGKYLYFTSYRYLTPHYHEDEWNAYFTYSNYIFALPLADDTVNPLLIKNDECKLVPDPSEKAKKDKVSGNKDSKKENSFKIDTGNLTERSFVLPVRPGEYNIITATEGKVFYGEKGEIKVFDMNSQKESEVGKGYIFALTPDNKSALFVPEGSRGNFTSDMSVVPFSDHIAAGSDKVDFSGVRTHVDFEDEWKQIFNETWRVYRDWFYCKNMNGRNWKEIHDRYAALLPYVRHRHDLTYLIGEMIGELSVGHSYVTSPAWASPKKIPMGLLGARCSKDPSGFFKIMKIFQGADWSEKFRSPLKENGLKMKEGMFILSVNGYDCRKMKDIHESLTGTVGKVVELVVNDRPKEEGARKIYIKPISDESNLAYYEWVNNNIAKVDKMSGGKIGYIHIPDMTNFGLEEFTRLFYTQLNKKALVIDDRGNGGGNVSPIIIEKLQRVIYRMTMSRNGGTPGTVPDAAHYGPKVLLIDRYSASDGDLFPYSFKTLGLGKLIGERTWGGIVGISGSRPYMDGQDVRTPFFTNYSVSTGDWIIENHGVDPDIVVDNNPFDEYKGIDRQLDKAVEILEKEMEKVKSLPGVPADHIAGN